MRLTLAFAAVAILLTTHPAGRRSVSRAGGAPASRVTLTEAEILAYLTPYAVALRRADAACDVELDLQRQGRDFYVFWLLNSCATPNQSPTVGYVAVNRWTGQVWDAGLTRPISTKLLRGVEEILRRTHKITAGTLAKYGRLVPPV